MLLSGHRLPDHSSTVAVAARFTGTVSQTGRQRRTRTALASTLVHIFSKFELLGSSLDETSVCLGNMPSHCPSVFSAYMLLPSIFLRELGRFSEYKSQALLANNLHSPGPVDSPSIFSHGLQALRRLRGARRDRFRCQLQARCVP